MGSHVMARSATAVTVAALLLWYSTALAAPLRASGTRNPGIKAGDRAASSVVCRILSLGWVRCYSAKQVRKAESRLTFTPTNPTALVQRLTGLPLQQVMLTTSSQDVTFSHAAGIYYIFTGSARGGLAVVRGCTMYPYPRRFLVVDEGTSSPSPGSGTPRLLHRNCGKGKPAIWTLSGSITGSVIGFDVWGNMPLTTLQRVADVLRMAQTPDVAGSRGATA